MKLPKAHRVALLSLFALFPAVPLLAQMDMPPAAQSDAPPPSAPGGGFHRGGGVEHRVDMLQRALNLTPEQTSQVKSVLEGERAKMEALRSNTALSQEDRHTQMMAIHGDTSTKMHTVLTADQAAKYDTLEARMREHRPGEGGAPPPPPAAPDPQ